MRIRSRFGMAVLIAALAAIIVLPATASAVTYSQIHGPMTFKKIETYRTKLANGKYTNYRMAFTKSGKTYYVFSLSSTKVWAFNYYSVPEASNNTLYRSSMAEIYSDCRGTTFNGYRIHAFTHSRDFVTTTNLRKSGSSTYLRVAADIRWDYYNVAE